MKVLITGSAGFLGRHFAAHHVRQHDTVVGVDDLSNATAPDEPEYAFYEQDAGAWFEQHHDVFFDVAYHFAAPVGGRVKIEGDPFYNAESFRLDSQFFRWAIQNTRLAVYPSSSAVYPISMQGEHGAALYEAAVHPGHPQWAQPDEMYGFTKFAGEFMAWKAAGYGLHTLCIRPFSGYGEGQSFEYPVPSILRRALRGDDPLHVWGPGNQTRDFVHVSDLVGATHARVRAGVIGYQSMNIGSGVPTTFVEVARLAAQLMGYQPTITADPDRPMGVWTRYADPTTMRAHYQPKVSLKEGLRRTLEWIDGASDASR
jgi:nucleoside-diphosphate-sugar epimerase